MRSNRPRDTTTELAFRRALHAAGLRFRKHLRPLPDLRCEPDVVFTRVRLAVFLDGCFWHGCTAHRAVRPKANAEWWANKLATTVARDRRNDAALEAAGWQVLRVWEHEPTDEAVGRVVERVVSRRRMPSAAKPTRRPRR
jgi:DNA mismatch endonuclease (patch repair protein)